MRRGPQAAECQPHGPPCKRAWGWARQQSCCHAGRKPSVKTGKLIFPRNTITSRQVNNGLPKAEYQCKRDLPHGLVLHLHFLSAGVRAHGGLRGTGRRKVLCVLGKWDTRIIYTPYINSISRSCCTFQNRGRIHLLEPSSSELLLTAYKCGRAYIHKYDCMYSYYLIKSLENK